MIWAAVSLAERLPQPENKMTNPFVWDWPSRTVVFNDGNIMPVIGLGTYSLKGDACVSSVLTALKYGYRLIDTASFYQNERSVGEAIRSSGISREEIFITTKLYPSQYAIAETAIDDALEKLGVGCVDLMLLHHPGKYDIAAYHAMERAVKAGKIRSIGLSCYYIRELEEFLPETEITPAVIQNELHPYYQDAEATAYIQKKGIVVEGWYPLGGRGYTKEMQGNEALAQIGARYGKTPAQVILRWNLQRNVAVIPGSSNPRHIKENTDIFDFELSAADMQTISRLDRREKHDWY